MYPTFVMEYLEAYLDTIYGNGCHTFHVLLLVSRIHLLNIFLYASFVAPTFVGVGQGWGVHIAPSPLIIAD